MEARRADTDGGTSVPTPAATTVDRAGIRSALEDCFRLHRFSGTGNSSKPAGKSSAGSFAGRTRGGTIFKR
jgi:hypothetical protein